LNLLSARVVELVDTLVSGASASQHAGSSPVPGTIITVSLIPVFSLTMVESNHEDR